MYSEIIELLKKEQEKFLKENKISDKNLRNNPKYMEFLKDAFKGLCGAAYEVAGNYRDSTDNERLKAPGNKARDIIGGKIQNAVIPCMHDQLYHMKKLGREQASDLVKQEVQLMNSRLQF